jgi:hypothetical protein
MSRPAVARSAMRPLRGPLRLRWLIPAICSPSSRRRSTRGRGWRRCRLACRSASAPSSGLRMHHMNRLVDEAEHIYYTWQTPAKGGRQLETLPTVGLRAKPIAHASAPWPARVRPVFARPLPGEGAWKPNGPPVGGRAPVLVTTFRTERDYPRIVAYVAWFDHTRTALAYTPAATSRRARRCAARRRFRGDSAGACSRPSTAASSTATA